MAARPPGTQRCVHSTRLAIAISKPATKPITKQPAPERKAVSTAWWEGPKKPARARATATAQLVRAGMITVSISSTHAGTSSTVSEAPISRATAVGTITLEAAKPEENTHQAAPETSTTTPDREVNSSSSRPSWAPERICRANTASTPIPASLVASPYSSVRVSVTALAIPNSARKIPVTLSCSAWINAGQP